MGKIQRHVSLAVALLLASAAAATAGQRPPAAKAGEQVIVTQSASGEELRGRLVELSSTSLAILVDDGRRVEVPVENVLRIDVRNDSLKNGAIIGGAIMAGITGLGCAAIDDAAYCATYLIFNTGFGVLAGMGIDALHKGRTPIYVKAVKSQASLQMKIRF
jgi:hypothetical protein